MSDGITSVVADRADAVGGAAPGDGVAVAEREGGLSRLRALAGARQVRVGAVIVLMIVLVAVFGPLFAPHSPTAFVGAPYEPSGSGLPLGADYVGRDVLSRFLSGGCAILIMAAISTLLGVCSGTTLGLLAGYRGGALDDVIMRVMDVVLAFPAVVLALLLVSMAGPKLWLIVLAVALTHTPQTARIMRSAAVQLTGREYISYAEGIGQSRTRIVLREILPNVTAPLTVEFGLRMTYSIGIVASLAFLGFGRQPPAADWGLMINENRSGVAIQPWGVVVPVIAIALLTIGTNLIADGVARASGGDLTR